MEETMLSVKAASDLLGVSTSTIYVMVRNNEIPFIKIRGRILFHRQTLENWILKNSINERG